MSLIEQAGAKANRRQSSPSPSQSLQQDYEMEGSASLLSYHFQHFRKLTEGYRESTVFLGNERAKPLWITFCTLSLWATAIRNP